MNDAKPLSEYILDRRCDRLDEWSMDEMSRNVKALEVEIEQLKKENEELKNAINVIGELAFSGSVDHSNAPCDCQDIYEICCNLTKDKE